MKKTKTKCEACEAELVFGEPVKTVEVDGMFKVYDGAGHIRYQDDLAGDPDAEMLCNESCFEKMEKDRDEMWGEKRESEDCGKAAAELGMDAWEYMDHLKEEAQRLGLVAARVWLRNNSVAEPWAMRVAVEEHIRADASDSIEFVVQDSDGTTDDEDFGEAAKRSLPGEHMWVHNRLDEILAGLWKRDRDFLELVANADYEYMGNLIHGDTTAQRMKFFHDELVDIYQDAMKDDLTDCILDCANANVNLPSMGFKGWDFVSHGRW